MSVEIFNPQTIIIWAIIDAIVDWLVFKIFRIRGITVLITVFLNFLIPSISFMLFSQSGVPFNEQIQVFGEIVFSYFINLFNFVISAAIGFIISVPLCLATGERPPESP